MTCIALTVRWERMVRLVVALTERFVPVLEVVSAVVVEGTVEEAATEAEAIQPLLRTQVGLIHHLIVFLFPDRITAAPPPLPPPPPPTTTTHPTPHPTPPPTPPPTSPPTIQPTPSPIQSSPSPSIQPSPTPSPGFNNVVVTQSSTEITWSSEWTVRTSPCNGTVQSKFTTSADQWFTYLTSPYSSK